MNKIILAVVLMFLLTFNSYGEEQKEYRSPYFNFTINYPSDWQAKELSGIIAFVSPIENQSDNFSENVNVLIENLSSNPMSLKEYWTASLMSAPKLIPDFQIIEEGKTEIGGKEASFLVYAGSNMGQKLKFKLYTFIVGHAAYNLTYTAREDDYDKYLPQAENIIQSIMITE